MTNSGKILIYDGFSNRVDDITKRAVDNALNKCKSCRFPKFLHNMKISLTSDFSYLDGHSSDSKFLSKYSDQLEGAYGYASLGQHEIFIQESAFLNFYGRVNKTQYNKIENTTMHELGHRFDETFAESDEKL